MDHMTDVNEDLLMDALAKAEQELLARRKMEYKVFTESKFSWNVMRDISLMEIFSWRSGSQISCRYCRFL